MSKQKGEKKTHTHTDTRRPETKSEEKTEQEWRLDAFDVHISIGQVKRRKAYTISFRLSVDNVDALARWR